MIAEWLAKVICVDVPRWASIRPFPSAAGGKACRWMVSLIRWELFICGTPFAIWAACAFLPEPWVRGAGQFADANFWSFFKTTALSNCTDTCRNLTFGMIVFPVSWIVALVGLVRLRSIAVEMEEQEKDWLYSSSWVEIAKDNLRSKSYRGYGTPLHHGGFVFLYCFWIASGFLLAGELTTSRDPPRAVTGFGMALATAIFTLALSAHGFVSRRFEAISKWHKANQPQ